MKWEGKQGSIWGESWRIIKDKKCSELDSKEPCKHCHTIRTKIHDVKWNIAGRWKDKTWVCPYVVIIDNVDGYDITGVCLDCIIELAEKVRT